MPNFGLLQEDCMAGLPEAAFCPLAQWHASVQSCTYSTSNTSVHQYIHYTVANTVAVIRGSYNGLPSTSTCQLTKCHRRSDICIVHLRIVCIKQQWCLYCRAKTRSGSLPAWRANKQTTVASALTLGSIMRNTIQKKWTGFIFEMTSLPLDFVSLPTYIPLPIMITNNYIHDICWI